MQNHPADQEPRRVLGSFFAPKSQNTPTWEQRKLKELYFQLTERNADLLPYQKTLSVATMSFRTDGNGAADTSLANYKRLRTGDIAFEGHTSKEFRYGRFVLNDVGDGIMSPRFSALRPLHEMPINFWKYYIHYEPIMRKVLVNSTKAGTMMNELVINEFLQESILVPSVAEQQAIGRFFKQLDTLITLHQRKYEKLVNIKKSMLDKMFPQNGESVPEIRFKGFTDPWEQRKFSELYEKVSRKNDLTYGKDDIISVANMYYQAESYITDENYLLTYNVFEMGDIAFEGNKSKNFAHGRFVENTIGNGIVSHVFDVFKPRMTNYDLQFWKYAINNERIMGPILLRSTKASTMMTNLVADDFLQENFLIPCYEEQKKIGEFLNQLDTLITLHQRKLEKLQNIKKSCLEKMFV